MVVNTHITVLYVGIKDGYINKISYGAFDRQICFNSEDRKRN